jgi:hypothetical protein
VSAEMSLDAFAADGPSKRVVVSRTD